MKKLYVINTARKISCLNNITGPVTTPTEIDEVDVLNLVRRGFDIYEVNPYNKRERTKVTTTNFNSITFKTTQTEMAKRKLLNREMQEMAKKEDKKETEPVKEEKEQKSEKSDKKDVSEKTSNKMAKPQSISHTDFEKH